MTSGVIAAATFIALVAGAGAMTERQSPDVTKQVPQAKVTVAPPNQQDQKNPFGNIDWGREHWSGPYPA